MLADATGPAEWHISITASRTAPRPVQVHTGSLMTARGTGYGGMSSRVLHWWWCWLSRNCVTPTATCLVVGWVWASVKSPNVAIVVAIWISTPWGIWRVSSLPAAPLCVRRQFLLVVKDCVWRFFSQDSGYIEMETEIPESTWGQQSFSFTG